MVRGEFKTAKKLDFQTQSLSASSHEQAFNINELIVAENLKG